MSGKSFSYVDGKQSRVPEEHQTEPNIPSSPTLSVCSNLPVVCNGLQENWYIYKIEQSSPKSLIALCMPATISFIYTKNNVGPRTDPCGIPEITSHGVE